MGDTREAVFEGVVASLAGVCPQSCAAAPGWLGGGYFKALSMICRLIENSGQAILQVQLTRWQLSTGISRYGGLSLVYASIAFSLAMGAVAFGEGVMYIYEWKERRRHRHRGVYADVPNVTV